MYKLFVLAALAAFVSGTLMEEDSWMPTGRIVGGKNVDIKEAPYQVSLRRSGRHFCGGSIISKDYILTAAHCAMLKPSMYEVYVGSSSRKENGTVYNVTEVVQHPDFGINFKGVPINDIAMMKVSKPFELSDQVRPIAMAITRKELEEGIEGVVTGWGKMDEQSYLLPTMLQLVKIPIISKESCNKAYRSMGGLPKNQICAAYPDGKKDACQGDSGGPLAIDGVLVGITSWGNGCAAPGNPGVYTEVSAFRDWIRETTGV